jgi:hypothetical protein
MTNHVEASGGGKVWRRSRGYLAKTHTTHAILPITPTMAPTAPEAAEDWATDQVIALVEFWTLVAEHSGVVGAWRLTGVCVASREGAKAWLRTLPGLVVCGGVSHGQFESAVCRLDLGELRWEHTSALTLPRSKHACCAVRGGVVVLAGQHARFKPDENEVEDSFTASVEISGYEQIFRALPPLSSGPRFGAAAVAIDESESEQGQVLLIGGHNGRNFCREVQKVDLATGVCTPLPSLLSLRRPMCKAARLPDGRVVCVGEKTSDSEGITAEVPEELPDQGSLTSQAGWRWRELPGMSVARYSCGGCVLSDGRFAVFGGTTAFADASTRIAACEVLILDGEGERWEPLPPMHDARLGMACVAVGGCVIVAGGDDIGTSVEVYEEALGLWRRLPCSLPLDAGRRWMDSALM